MNQTGRRPGSRGARGIERLHHRHRNDLWTDFFCGAGGASTGLVQAGFGVATAANHWDVAIDTHGANHPDTEHVCADINNYDMRRLTPTRFLWASVICTEESPAGGKKRDRRPRGQLDLLEVEGKVDTAGLIRTRACALDVIRATEVHHYDLVVVENVCDFYADWALFDWWTDGMRLLGYEHRVFSINSAHVSSPSNAPAPQWRDRIYVVFARQGVPMPDLVPSPLAFCPECGVDVAAVQSWKNGNTVGKYRQQYDYRCPSTACRHQVVEPYIRPAADAIDWSNLGTQIGNRREARLRPLAASTLTKIQRGLTEYADLLEPLLVTTTHGKDGGPRAMPARLVPLPTRTTKIGDGFVVPPGALPAAGFIHEQRGGGSAYRPLTHPLGTLSTSRNHGLVIPYRREGRARPTGQPMLTLATHDSAGLLLPAYEVEDCWYRMLQPREQLTAQRFPQLYIVHGTKGEQTMQAGNAVSCNVAQWIGERIHHTLYRLAA
jgi:DNA (cytosine-5)-methyltransferase 1